MFEKNVYISNKYLKVGKKKILWPDIYGVRAITGDVIEKISPAFPRAELFLEDGRVVVISNRNKFFFNDETTGGVKEMSPQSSISLVKEKAKNTIPELNNYFELHLLFVVAICQISSGIVGVIKQLSFSNIILLVVISCIIGSIFGLAIERIKRNKLLNKAKSKQSSSL